MPLKITKTDVWSAEIKDQPGGLAVCLDTLAAAGANLECLIARRQPNKPGTGLVFVTPLKGRKVRTAAKAAGFHPSKLVATLKVEGADRAGVGARIAQTVAAAGINLRGTSAVVIGRKFVSYLAFDDWTAAGKAAVALRALSRKV
jgi:hypothetical protein